MILDLGFVIFLLFGGANLGAAWWCKSDGRQARFIQAAWGLVFLGLATFCLIAAHFE